MFAPRRTSAILALTVTLFTGMTSTAHAADKPTPASCSTSVNSAGEQVTEYCTLTTLDPGSSAGSGPTLYDAGPSDATGPMTGCTTTTDTNGGGTTQCIDLASTTLDPSFSGCGTTSTTPAALNPADDSTVCVMATGLASAGYCAQQDLTDNNTSNDTPCNDAGPILDDRGIRPLLANVDATAPAEAKSGHNPTPAHDDFPEFLIAVLIGIGIANIRRGYRDAKKYE